MFDTHTFTHTHTLRQSPYKKRVTANFDYLSIWPSRPLWILHPLTRCRPTSLPSVTPASSPPCDMCRPQPHTQCLQSRYYNPLFSLIEVYILSCSFWFYDWVLAIQYLFMLCMCWILSLSWCFMKWYWLSWVISLHLHNAICNKR